VIGVRIVSKHVLCCSSVDLIFIFADLVASQAGHTAHTHTELVFPVFSHSAYSNEFQVKCLQFKLKQR
jgi:hypothetical protein